MDDAEVISVVKASYAEIHMDVPLDVIVRRGRRLRAQRRLPGLAAAAVIVAALVLAVAAVLPGSGRATAPGGSTGTGRSAAWTVVSQPNGSVRVALRGLIYVTWPGFRTGSVPTAYRRGSPVSSTSTFR